MKTALRLVGSLLASTALASLAAAQAIGVEYCTSSPNSSGQAGKLEAFGVPEITSGNVILLASQCPPGKPLIFFYGPQATSMPLGAGTLCIDPAAGGITRILPPKVTDALGTAVHSLTSAQLSGPFGGTPMDPTLNYQAWFRDPIPMGTVSNLTSALRISYHPCQNCQ